jgi:hypothetical protein
VLTDLIRKRPKNADEITPQEGVILQTWRMLFGDIYFLDWDEANEESIIAIDRMRDDLTDIWTALEKPELPYLDLWCDDSFLDPEEDLFIHGGRTRFNFDSNPGVRCRTLPQISETILIRVVDYRDRIIL